MLSGVRTASGTKIPDCIVFLSLCFSEVAAENLRKAGIITDLLTILGGFPHNAKICLSCCGVLWSLAVGGKENTVLCLDSCDLEAVGVVPS